MGSGLRDRLRIAFQCIIDREFYDGLMNSIDIIGIITQRRGLEFLYEIYESDGKNLLQINAGDEVH